MSVLVTEYDQQDAPPGSTEARDRGCICAVIDNAYGRGVPWPRADGRDPERHPSFWVTRGCPVHSRSIKAP